MSILFGSKPKENGVPHVRTQRIPAEIDSLSQIDD